MKVELGLASGLLSHVLLHFHALFGAGSSSLHLEAVGHPLSKQAGATGDHAY